MNKEIVIFYLLLKYDIRNYYTKLVSILIGISIVKTLIILARLATGSHSKPKGKN